MVLHTLNRGPASNSLQQCLAQLSAGDALVLLGDGVYCALAGTAEIDQLLVRGASIYALAPDVTARGLQDRCAGTVELIDFEQLATLSESFARQLAWF